MGTSTVPSPCALCGKEIAGTAIQKRRNKYCSSECLLKGRGIQKTKNVQQRQEKKCPSCRTTLPIEKFYARNNNAWLKCSYCHNCISKKQREWRLANSDWAKLREGAWKAKNSKKVAEARLKSRYGITLNFWAGYVNSLDGRCEICTEQIELCVDHDHRTGTFRGALCNRCNIGLGAFAENGEVLKRATAYLKTKEVPKASNE